MVSSNLENAAGELSESVLEFEVENLVVGSAGVAAGALSAEMAGDFARDFLSGRRGVTQDAGEVLARYGAGAGLAAVHQAADVGPMGSTLLGFAAFTASATGVVRAVEIVLQRTGAFGSNGSSATQKARRASRAASSSTKPSRSSGSSRSSTSSSSRNRSSRVSVSSPSSGKTRGGVVSV